MHGNRIRILLALTDQSMDQLIKLEEVLGAIKLSESEQDSCFKALNTLESYVKGTQRCLDRERRSMRGYWDAER